MIPRSYDPQAPLPPGPLVLTAAAGAGRTHTLAALAGRLVSAGHAPARILLVAPRRHGLRALQAALPAAAAEADLRTVDGLAAALGARLGPALGLTAWVGLSPAEDRLRAREALADFWGRRVAASASAQDRIRQLGRLDLAPVALAAARAAAAPAAQLHPANSPDAVVAFTAAVCADARAVLPARRWAAGQPTAPELWTHLAAALADPPRAAPLQAAAHRSWSALLVDDAQDLDPAAAEALQRLLPGAPLYLTWDPRQRLPSDLVERLRGAPGLPPQRLSLSGPSRRADAGLAPALATLFDPERVGPLLPPGPALPATGAAPAALGDPARPPLALAWLDAPPDAHPQAAEDAALDRCAADLAALLGEGRFALDDVLVVIPGQTQARALQDRLRARGIPASRVGGGSVLHAPVADDLALWLTALVAPSPRVIRAALGSPLGGHSAEALLELTRDETTWSAWLEQIRRLAGLWESAGILPLVQRLRAELDLSGGWLRHPDGARRLTDLRHLAERLHAEAAARRLRPAALLAWFEAARAAPDPALAGLRAEQGQGAVRLLTPRRIRDHQAAVVFLPCAWQPPPPAGPAWFSAGGDAPGGHLALTPLSALPAPLRRAAEDDARAAAHAALYLSLTRARHHAVITWGPLPGAPESALAALLHPQPTWPDRVALHLRRLDPAGWRAELASLVAHPGFGWLAPSAAASAPARSPGLAAARPFPTTRGVDLAWRRTSFSGLTHGAPHAIHAGADEPEPEADPGPLTPGAPLALDPLPPGAVTGTCLHGILERWDFQDPAALPALAHAGLALHGLEPGLGPTVCAGLAAAIQVPLHPGGPRLADIPRAARLDELAFVLPVERLVDGRALAEVLQAHPGPDLPAGYASHLAHLGAEPVHGFLSGSVDLVFCHAGRWYVVDYKSNRLGASAADYGRAGLDRAMLNGHYVLQAHLYAVALHRYLGLRLGAAYDPAAQLGGLAWLFLRGMHPDHPEGCGVWFAQPPPARIQALSDRLAAAPARLDLAVSG